LYDTLPHQCGSGKSRNLYRKYISRGFKHVILNSTIIRVLTYSRLIYKKYPSKAIRKETKIKMLVVEICVAYTTVTIYYGVSAAQLACCPHLPKITYQYLF
jgi:hypothetical protein